MFFKSQFGIGVDLMAYADELRAQRIDKVKRVAFQRREIGHGSGPLFG